MNDIDHRLSHTAQDSLPEGSHRNWCIDSLTEMEGRVARPLVAPLPDIVGLGEIADRLNVNRATVDQWRSRHVLPPADWELQGGPVWRWETIALWARHSGR